MHNPLPSDCSYDTTRGCLFSANECPITLCDWPLQYCTLGQESAVYQTAFHGWACSDSPERLPWQPRTIHFDEHLVERVFALIITPAKPPAASCPADSVDFVDKNNARGMRARLLKEVAYLDDGQDAAVTSQAFHASQQHRGCGPAMLTSFYTTNMPYPRYICRNRNQ